MIDVDKWLTSLKGLENYIVWFLLRIEIKF